MVFLEGVSKRLFAICDPQKLCSAENTCFMVLSGLPKNSGLCFNMQKGVFNPFILVLGGWVFVFLSLSLSLSLYIYI